MELIMKTLLKLSLALLVMSANFLAQGPKWSWVNPYPTADEFYDCYFLDSSNCIAATSSGIIKSTDKGVTWSASQIPYPNMVITKFFFVDNLYGWAIGDIGYNGNTKLLKTTDGGSEWFEQAVPSLNAILNDVFMLDQDNGWLVGSDNKIFRTTNSGLSWVTKNISSGNGVFNFTNAQFNSLLTGFVTGTYTDYYTYTSKHTVGYSIDGGNNWNFKYSGLKNEISDFDLLSDSIMISTTQDGLILLSNDKSESWKFKMQEFNRNIYNLNFLDSSLGIAACDSGYILKVTNNGEDFEQKYTGYNVPLSNARILNEDFIYATGNPADYYNYPLGSFFLTSSDGGDIWENKIRSIAYNLSFVGISMPDSLNIWLCADQKLLHTNDGGYSWFEPTQVTGMSAQDICFTDSANGYVAGSLNNQAVILRTSNAGQTWQQKYFSQNYSIKKLVFPEKEIGYASAEYKIFKTTDAGQNWIQCLSVTNDNISDFHFVNASTGYAISGYYQPNIYKTIDGGTTWNIISILNSNVRKICFVSENIGFAIGDYDLYKTTNGGTSWTQSFLNLYNTINDFVFINSQKGWVCTYNGIKSTTNGGTTWNDEFSTLNLVNTNFLALDVKNNTGLWAAGSRSSVIKYNGEIIITDIPESEINQAIPNEYSLSQNYPNPFNPRTTIQFALPEQAKVTLKIFDVLGAEVATLKNEILSPGNYSVEWNASNYASGIYIYKLETEKFSDTKKLILMK